MARFAGVDDYVAALPPEAAAAVGEIRRRVRALVPDGVEVIRYDMPTVQLDGRSLLHYAGWKRHVSIYPTPEADPELAAELAPYSSGQGTTKFPLDRPVPYDLVDRMVRALLDQRARS